MFGEQGRMLWRSAAGQHYCTVMDVFHPQIIINGTSMCPIGYSDFVSKSRGMNFIVRSSGGESDSNNGDRDKNKGESLSTDWDKAWSNFRKQGKKTLFSQFDVQKYVSRNPRPSNYPLSEEVDPLRRSERSALSFWTSPKFTIACFGIVVGLLIFYIVLK
eukprot:Gb_39492 [translate_table: standard]